MAQSSKPERETPGDRAGRVARAEPPPTPGHWPPKAQEVVKKIWADHHNEDRAAILAARQASETADRLMTAATNSPEDEKAARAAVAAELAANRAHARVFRRQPHLAEEVQRRDQAALKAMEGLPYPEAAAVWQETLGLPRHAVAGLTLYRNEESERQAAEAEAARAAETSTAPPDTPQRRGTGQEPSSGGF